MRILVTTTSFQDTPGRHHAMLEKEPDLPVDLRASTFHPPSLEMIADLGLGVIEEMLEKMKEAAKTVRPD